MQLLEQSNVQLWHGKLEGLTAKVLVYGDEHAVEASAACVAVALL